MLATYKWVETSPSSAATAASSQPVQNAASWAPAGVAGGMVEDADAVEFIAELVGATGGTLDVYVQSGNAHKDASGNTAWFDLVHFPQLANGASAVKYRVQVSMVGQPASAAPVVIGSGNAPALAANVAVQSVCFDRLRLLMVAGSGTTTGAAVTVTASSVKSYVRK